jgi:hypothetical protein
MALRKLLWKNNFTGLQGKMKKNGEPRTLQEESCQMV